MPVAGNIIPLVNYRERATKRSIYLFKKKLQNVILSYAECSEGIIVNFDFI